MGRYYKKASQMSLFTRTDRIATYKSRMGFNKMSKMKTTNRPKNLKFKNPHLNNRIYQNDQQKQLTTSETTVPQN